MTQTNNENYQIPDVIGSPLLTARYIAGRNDPILFVKYFLSSTTWAILSKHPKQQQFLREAVKAQEGILRAGSRSGKTYTMSILFLWFLFYRDRPDISYFKNDYTKTFQLLNAALTLNQAKILLNNVVDLIKGSDFLSTIGFIKELKEGQSPELVTIFNSKLDVRPTVHGGRHILGEYYDVINIDEAASEPDLNHLRYKTLGSRRTDVAGRMFFTSTPQGASTFREVWFELAESKKKGRPIVLGRFEQFDNPVNSREFIESAIIYMSQAQITEEVYGKFADFSSSFFAVKDVANAFYTGARIDAEVFIPLDDPITGECISEGNNIHKPYYVRAQPNRKYYHGLDIAGQGADFTVLVTLEEYNNFLTLVAFERVSKMGLLGKSGVIERVRRRLTHYPGDMYYDASSLGGHQLTELLQDQLTPKEFKYCTGISSVRKPGRSEINNKRIMLNYLSILLERGMVVIPEHDRLKVLKNELRFYQLDDDGLQQDCVMATALAGYAFWRGKDVNPDFGGLLDLIAG